MHGLEIVFYVIAAVWVLAIAFGWSPKRGNYLMLLGGGTLVYVVCFIAWWYVLSSDFVRYDLLKLNDMNESVVAWLYMTPPFVAVVGYAVLFRRGYVV